MSRRRSLPLAFLLKSATETCARYASRKVIGARSWAGSVTLSVPYTNTHIHRTRKGLRPLRIQTDPWFSDRLSHMTQETQLQIAPTSEALGTQVEVTDQGRSPVLYPVA